ncbi:IS66 family transposase zinc-finger binding domain-containing protein, partial [Streptococcus danieliae]|nr:IS66 family transposase zinc-finger binding domain-containing protein [Streptococcus danieliae]
DLKEIGTELKRRELVFIPAQLKRLDHIQHAYKCQTCSEKSDKGTSKNQKYSVI